jgi:hypothetical protein
VLVDGRVIFSKAEAGRFPADGEVEEIFAALKPGAKASAENAPAAKTADDPGDSGRSGMLRRLADKFRN